MSYLKGDRREDGGVLKEDNKSSKTIIFPIKAIHTRGGKLKQIGLFQHDGWDGS